MIVDCDGPVIALHDIPQENIVVSIQSSRHNVVGLHEWEE